MISFQLFSIFLQFMIILIGRLIFLLQLTYSLSVNISKRECILNYHLSNTSLEFDSCQSYSTTFSFSYNTWNQCSFTCCELSHQSFPIFDGRTLQRCRNSVQSSNSISLQILIMVAMVSLAIVLTIAFIIYKVIMKWRKNRIMPKQKIQEDIIKELKWLSMNQGTEQILQTENDIVKKQDTCAICLQIRPNMKLPCFHWFHLSCFSQWIQRSKECPLCRMDKFSQVMAYCSKCYNRYTFIHFKKLIIAYKGLNLTILGQCDHCQKIQRASSTFQQSFQAFKRETKHAF